VSLVWRLCSLTQPGARPGGPAQSHSTDTGRSPRLMARWRAAARWRVAVAAAIAACALLAPSAADAAQDAGAAGDAAAARQAGADAHVTLAKLEARAAKLSKQYRGQIVKLTEAAAAARAAADHAGRLSRRLAAAERQMARLAAASYMDTGLNPSFALLADGDPQRGLDRSATVEYLARLRGARAQALGRLVAAANIADRASQVKVAELRRLIASLMSQRRAVERLMAKFQPESPIIGDNITPRMRQVRDEVDRRFGPFSSIGCYRPGGDGEHPLGRACDFMLSTGGVMPSAANVQRGYDIASWAQANASRLGIMYIIYRQRLWDIRMASSGWIPMDDRGSITANHFDHVHISVF
jgi:hypothetical protein